MINNVFPIARKKDVVVQELPDEVLIYDLKSNKAMCLNEISAFVWHNCDGKNYNFANQSISERPTKNRIQARN